MLVKIVLDLKKPLSDHLWELTVDIAVNYEDIGVTFELFNRNVANWLQEKLFKNVLGKPHDPSVDIFELLEYFI